jgi:hypothetical protein
VILAAYVYTLVDLARTPGDEVRSMPKWAWVVVLLVLGPLGAIGWFVFGRPRAGSPPPGGGAGGQGGIGAGPRPRPGRPVAPDDDPAFLKRLDEQSWAARMERLRRERQAADGTDGATGAPPEGPAGDSPAGESPDGAAR